MAVRSGGDGDGDGGGGPLAAGGGSTGDGDGGDGDGNSSGGTAARQHNTHAVSTYVCGQLSNMCAGKEGGKGNAPAMRAV